MRLAKMQMNHLLAKQYRKVSALFAFVLVFSFIIETSVHRAHAASTPVDALTAVGISTGAGALLGLSTTAFYAQPGDHLKNVLVGGAVGMIVGVGIAAYMLTMDQDNEQIDPDELLIPLEPEDSRKSDPNSDSSKDKKPGDKTNGTQLRPLRSHKLAFDQISVHETTRLLPATKGWNVAMNLVELRF